MIKPPPSFACPAPLSRPAFVSRQKGVALISVLLVFALATLIAGEVMSRNYRDLLKTANFLHGMQAYHYALSGEQYARQLLYRDYSEQKSRGISADTLKDIWASELPDFEIEGGEMTIEIHDLQGRFNLNNLVNPNSGLPDTKALQDYRQLQQTLSLSSDYADRIVDWIDGNTSLYGDGAEDADYTGGYLPANQPLVDISELLLIKQMQREDYLLLKPVVTALPTSRVIGSKYNINTVDAKLLQALTALSDGEIAQIQQRQQQGGYRTLKEWLTSPGGSGLASVKQRLTVKSAFFEVVVRASFQQRVCLLSTYLYRDPDDGTISVIKRQRG